MSEEEYDYIFKVLLIGNSDVGKSSIILRYVDETWTDVFVPTIGVDFKVKTLKVDNKQVKCKFGTQQVKNVLERLFPHILGVPMVYFSFMISQTGIHSKIWKIG